MRSEAIKFRELEGYRHLVSEFGNTPDVDVDYGFGIGICTYQDEMVSVDRALELMNEQHQREIMIPMRRVIDGAFALYELDKSNELLKCFTSFDEGGFSFSEVAYERYGNNGSSKSFKNFADALEAEIEKLSDE